MVDKKNAANQFLNLFVFDRMINYEDAVEKIADKSRHDLRQLTTHGGKKITLVMRHAGSTKMLCDVVREKHGCNACVSRCKKLGRLSTINKKGAIEPLFMISPNLLDDSYRKRQN